MSVYNCSSGSNSSSSNSSGSSPSLSACSSPSTSQRSLEYWETAIDNPRSEEPCTRADDRVFALWEYERYFPVLKAWKPPFLPTDPYKFCTIEGEPVPNFDANTEEVQEALKVPPSMKVVWQSSWIPSGWQYAKAFVAAFHPDPMMLDMVRRRLWERQYRVEPQSLSARLAAARDVPPLRHFLASIQLEFYTENFLAHGFPDVKSLALAQDDDWRTLDVSLGHWRVIQSALSELAESLAVASPWKPSPNARLRLLGMANTAWLRAKFPGRESEDAVTIHAGSVCAVEGNLLKRGGITSNWQWKNRYYCIPRDGTRLIGVTDMTSKQAQDSLELKGAVYVSVPFALEERPEGWIWGVSPAGQKRISFFECATKDERNSWEAAVLEAGATSGGTVDTFDCEMEHSPSPLTDRCEVQNCLQPLFRQKFCILHYNLIAQTGEAARWTRAERVKRCQKCSVDFDQQRPTSFVEAVTKYSSRPKFNCRQCGGVFCGECCGKMSSLPKIGFRDLVRVCVDCERVESRRRVFLMRDLSLALKGQVMRKLTQKGKQKLIFLHLDYEELQVCLTGLGKDEEDKKEDALQRQPTRPRMFPFHEKGKIEKKDKRRKKGKKLLPLADIVEVAMAPSPPKCARDPACCFMIVGKCGSSSYTKYLECLEPTVARNWVQAISECLLHLKPEARAKEA